jgi:hypothetical protein
MDLKYSLVENHITDKPDDSAAQAHPTASLDREATIGRILVKGTLLTRTDVLAVLNALGEVLSEGTREGCTFNLPMFNTSFSISGVFDGPLDSFDHNRHRLHINLTKGTLLREAERNVKLEKINVSAPMPQIQEVKDSVSGSVNERLTPGGVVELRGYGLRIDGDDPACGLWFTSGTGDELKAPVIIENKPSRIIAMIPALPEGTKVSTVRIRVVTQYSGGGKFLATPKVFVYPKALSLVL